MKSVFKLFGIIGFIAALLFAVTACDNDTGGDKSNVYPYTQHGIWNMGYKSGLNSGSSDQEFDEALNEVLQAYRANNPSSADGVTAFNGVTYDIISWESITGKEPKYVWDAFWQDLGIYQYFIGTCWLFNYVEIPSKKETGTIYVINAIVTDLEGGGYIRYWSSKGILYPVESRSILQINLEDRAPGLCNAKLGDVHIEAAFRFKR